TLELRPADLLGGTANTSLTIAGVDIDVHGGRTWFDRVGALMRTTQPHEAVTLTPRGILDMTFDESAEQWVGDIPVQANVSFALQFTNELGHANPRMKPIDIVATEDQPPSVVIEHPKRDVTLAEPVMLPVILRAFDDWALAEVGLAFSRDGVTFAEPQWVESYDEALTDRHVVTGVDPQRLTMRPGETIFYRGVVRDRKGQVAYSEPRKVTLASPGESGAERSTLNDDLAEL